MNALETFCGSPLVHRLGCGLLHFVWEGLLIALILAVAMRMLRGRSPGARYLAAWAALLAMAASVPVTAWLMSPPAVVELAGTAADLPGAGLSTDPAADDADTVSPSEVDQVRITTPAPAPLVELPAATSSPAFEDAEVIPGVPLVVRASQWVHPALPWVVCCWVTGTLGLAVWRLGGWVALRRLCRLGTSPASQSVAEMLARLLPRLRIRRAVELLESTLVEVPTVIGWLRPVILLPASIVAELPAEQLELILAHELAHIRRHDFLLNLLQTAIETLLFYHPAVWWVSRRIRLEREACCDDLAVAGYPLGGGDRLLYARALTRLEELRHEPAGLLPARMGVAADGAPLLGRIRRVVGLPGDDQQGRRTWLGGGVAVLLLVGALVGYVATAGEFRRQAAAAAQPGEPGPSSASSSSAMEWGEAVEGVQVRLRAARPRWNEGATIRLWADVRNQGQRNLLVDAWGPGCELEVDGQWYRQPLNMLGIRPALRPFPPGRQYDNIAVEVGQTWELKSSQSTDRPGRAEPVRLVLTPGKHTIRVAFTPGAPGAAPGQHIRAVSNPVVIEIVSAKEIAARPERLKSQQKAFELRLAYVGPRENRHQSGVENPFRSLVLHTVVSSIRTPSGWSAVSISEEQAARIIDLLEREGFLTEALPFPDEDPPVPDGPAYTLTVKGPEKLVLYQPLGWGLTVLDHLESLRTVLAGDAATALGQVLARLEPQRKEWEAGGRWGQAVEGVQIRLRPQQPTWRSAATPSFSADVRNLGVRRLLVYRAGNFWTSSELEIDGRLYRRRLPEHDYRPPLSDLVPGRQFDNVLVELSRGWYLTDSPNRSAEGTGVTESQPGQLKLAPGRHTFRVAVTMPLAGNRPGDYVRAVSNPVEIEIVAGSAEKVGAGQGSNTGVTTGAASGAEPGSQTPPAPAANDAVKRAALTGGEGSSGATRPGYAGVGLVVDDATGKPVEQIAIQEGVPNASAESGIMWITAIQSPRGVAGGRFSVTHGWVRDGKVRIRIVADGYLPEVAIVDTEDGLLKAPLVMRLRRGEAIRGRVLDHAGKPVAGAKVFLGGSDRHAEIVDGRPERSSGKRETTDKDGRFVIYGASPGEVNQIVLLPPGLHVWTVLVPELGKELTVKLPEPATLVIRYDIPGDVPEGRFRVELKTWDMPDWNGRVSSVQNPTAKNQGEVVLKNMTPGVYDVIRMKELRVADRGTEAFCDRGDVTLEPGKTTTLRFVRQKAFPIEGDVVGLEATGTAGAFIFVRSPKATGDPESRDDWKLPIYDGTTSAKDGKFKTAPIEPGEYLLVADAYDPQPPGMGFGMEFGSGWSLPAYVGTAKVTVPEDGPPPRVRIEMKPRAASPKAPSARAPAKASAEAAGETLPGPRVVDSPRTPVEELEPHIAWSKAAENGLQAGVVLDPRKDSYRVGEVVRCRFFFRNTGREKFELNPPKLLEARLTKPQVIDAQARPIATATVSEDEPLWIVGADSVWLHPGDKASEVNGSFLAIGRGKENDAMTTVLKAAPGQSCRVRFTVHDYADARRGDLQTGWIPFKVLALADEASDDGRTNRVIDAEGKPVAGAKVEFCTNPVPDDPRPFASTVTNEAGEFSYPDPAPERMQFRFYVFVSAPGFRTDYWIGNQEVYRREGGVRLPDTLNLARPATVSGTVLGADGKPLAGVPLAVDCFTERRTEANPRRVVSDQEGRFKIDDLPPADIFIRYEKGQNETVKGAGDAQLFISHVRAKDGQQVENVVIDLSQATCVLEGQVVDHQDKGIANASVKATFAASAKRLVHYAWARTDQDGRYRIGGLPPDEFLVSASTKNHFGEPGQRVKLDVGQTKTRRLLGYLPGHPAPEPKPDDPRWGKPAGDLRAVIELRPSRATYSMGETVEARPVLRNTSDKTVTLVHNFTLAAELQVTDETGKVQTFSYKGFLGEAVATTYVLEPGHEVDMQGSVRLKLVGSDFTEHLVQSPGTPLAFPLKSRPGAKYTLSYDLGDGLRTGDASLLVKQ